MKRYTLEQREEIMQTYFQSQCCVAQTVRSLKRSFGRNKAPTAPAVRKLVQKVRETGLLVDKIHGPRRRTVRNEKNMAVVAESVLLNPEMSIRQRAIQLNISRTSLMRILHKDLCGRPAESGEARTAVPEMPVVASGRSRLLDSGKSSFRIIVATGKRKGRPKKLQKANDTDDNEMEITDVENDDDQKDADVENDDDQKGGDVENDDDQKDADVENDDDQKDADVESDDDQKDADIENDDDQTDADVENDDDQKDAAVKK